MPIQSDNPVTTTVTPQRLAELFRPQRIALIGASNKSGFSQMLFHNLVEFGIDDRVYLINKRGVETHGRATFTSCRDVGERIDTAFMMVPAAGVPEALEDAAAAGIRTACFLTAGYAEEGSEGMQRQRELVSLAQKLGITLLGPNCVGFMNAVDGIPTATFVPLPKTHGSIGIVAQSGGVAAMLTSLAISQNYGITYAVTTGNEAMINAGHVVDFLVDDPHTKAIALYLEAIRDPENFLRAAARANAAGKAVVVYKVGRSELTAQAAASHTGALVGDDRVIDAVLRQHGIIRAESFEDVVITAGLAAATGPLRKGGIGFISIAGGALGPIADRASERGLAIPAFDENTVAALQEVLPSYATPRNPLDTTGAAVIDPNLYGQCVKIIAADPAIDVIVATGSNIPDSTDTSPTSDVMLQQGTTAARASGVPFGLMTMTLGSPTEFQRAKLDQYGAAFTLGGIRAGIDALAAVAWWSQRRQRARVEEMPAVSAPESAARCGAWSEQQAREMLRDAGIPVVPAKLVADADGAVAAAREFGTVALKIASPDILHKSDIGAVRLNVRGEEARAAFEDILRASHRHAPHAQIDGVLVAPMRKPALELMVGVVRDAEWGHILAVGLGGIFVEVLGDSALRRLPVAADDVRDMLDSLKGAPLLRGARGTQPADIDALVSVICRFAALAATLGDDLESLEINPLRVDGAQIEALDALVTWRAAP